MTTITPIPTITMTPSDPALVLHQWLSPAFPVGAFSYSHGLETVVARGLVHDLDTACDWIGTALRHGAGQADAILLASAWRAQADAIPDLTALALSLSPSRERRAETLQTGTALAATITALTGHDLPEAPYPVVLGRAARLCDLPLDLTLKLFLQAFVANLASAAVRLVPLGQTDGQRITQTLSGAIPALAQGALHGDTDRIGTAAIALDLASMSHETLTTRLFQS